MGCEEEILCIPPLASSRDVSVGKANVDMDWLVADIKDLLAIVGVSIVGREKVVLEFQSSILLNDVRVSSCAKEVSEKNKDSFKRGISRDCLSRELLKLSTLVNYGEKIGATSKRGRNLLTQ